MARPWNNWFHCIGTLKHAWLRGDERGWRARHHREHVEGDYKHPPPEGMYESQRRRTVNLMALHAPEREAVMLDEWSQRVEMCRLLAGAVRHYEAGSVALAVGVKHYHVLVRFAPVGVPTTGVGGLCAAHGVGGLCEAHVLKDARDPAPRYVLGKCHSWCARQFRHWMLREMSVTIPSGGLFAPRPKCIPVEDREHQVRVARYIFDHADEGAAVYSILAKEGVISATAP